MHQASAKYIILCELLSIATQKKFGAMHEYVSMSSLPKTDISCQKRPMNMFINSYLMLCGVNFYEEDTQFEVYQDMLDIADSFGLDIDQVFALKADSQYVEVDISEEDFMSAQI